MEKKTNSKIRIKLGIVLNEIGQVNKIQVSQEEMQQALYQYAGNFPGQEQEVVEYFKKNPDAAMQIQAPLYENKVVDFVLGKVKLKNKELDLDSLPKSITLYTQTTKSKEKFYEIVSTLTKSGTDVNVNDTLCSQVSNRDTQLQEFSTNFDKIIICAGIWSKKLASLFGDQVPLESERGYHISYKNFNPITHPVAWQERGTYFTPMNDGLRVAGVVEFAGLEREISTKVNDFLSRSANQVFSDIPSHDNEWLGFRPSVPDSLPVVGQSKKNPYIYYCFGHQHVGWSLGGITGKLIAQEATANKTDIDLEPFSIGRF